VIKKTTAVFAIFELVEFVVWKFGSIGTPSKDEI